MTTFATASATDLPDGRQSTIERLLGRMRAGDRAAAAEFMARFGSRIRRRIHFKLTGPMRRLFDSQEILSTVARRLDLYVGRDRMEAARPDELWALVFRIADNALIDKVRLFHRLEAVEGSDAQFAQTLLSNIRRAESENSSGVELEMDRVFTLVELPIDRQILSLWLGGDEPSEIARQLHMTQEAVRQRWQRLREKLRELIEDGLL